MLRKKRMEIIPDYQARPAGPNFQTVQRTAKNYGVQKNCAILSISFSYTFQQDIDL
jgi:hypothetical protein